MNPPLSRRGLITASSGMLILKPETVRGSQANSSLSVGLVGCGRRGMFDAGLFVKTGHANIAAVCDIYDDQIAAAKKQFPSAQVYRRYQDLLAANLDAVILVTPPYQRPEQFELAVAAAKHLYIEKPLAVDPAGCRRMLAASQKVNPAKRISVGFQQRYGKDYLKAYGIVKSGQMGSIQMIRASWMAGDLPLRKGHPASEEKMRNWVWYRDTSGDIVVEQDCHNFDVVNWFMGTHPDRVSGFGGRRTRTYGDNLDNLTLSFEFTGGVHFSYTANQFCTRGYRDIGETFICDKGAMNTSRQGYRWFNKVVDETPVDKGYRTATPEEVPAEAFTKYDITEDAVAAFVDGVRAGQAENAVPAGVETMYTAIMARQAIYTRKEVTWAEVQRA
jgi:myo-inositol 2-dehydrogenase / D-chiro-inositol 1-dehydrogenase